METCAKLQQKNIHMYDSWSLSKLSIFIQNTWFLENKRALLIIITLQTKSVHKIQFYINHGSHLKNAHVYKSSVETLEMKPIEELVKLDET